MERPERPRRHKTIIHRQTPRSNSRARPPPPPPPQRYEFEVGCESDSDTDMEVDAYQTQSTLAEAIASVDEALGTIKPSRPPRQTTLPNRHLTNNITEVGTTLFSTRAPIKRFRPHITIPYTVSANGDPTFVTNAGDFMHIPPMQTLADTAIPLQPAAMIKTDDEPSTSSGRSGDPGPSTSSSTRTLGQSASLLSGTNPSGSRILQEIDQLCYAYPPRPRLTGLRRLNALRLQREGTQNEVLDYTNSRNNTTTALIVNSSNPFSTRESPQSPPLVDTGHQSAVEEQANPAALVRHNRRTFRVRSPSAPPFVFNPVLGEATDVAMAELGGLDPLQRPTENNITQNTNFSLRINALLEPINISPPISQPRSPVPLEPHTPNTSPPVSPILPVYSNLRSPFSPNVIPTSPLTTPPSSPTRANQHFSLEFVSRFYEGETSEEDNISAEDSNPINEVIVLDTPERPTFSERPPSTEPENTPEQTNFQANQSSQLKSSSSRSPSHTPPLDAMPTNTQKKSQKNLANASETLKKLNQNLVSLLECPVCLDFMVPPILQCNKGHLVCATCRPKLTVCPTCRSRFAERNLAMEKVAERLMYPCKNVVTGCSVTMKLKDKLKHEQNCGFRHFDCIVGSCEWKGYKPELIVHLSLAHDEKLVLGNEKQLVVSYMNGRYSWVFYTYDEVFLLTIASEISTKKFSCCMQLIGAPEKAALFLYSIKLERKNPTMVMDICHQTHSDEFKPLSLFYASKGIVLDVSYIKQYAMPSNHRRVSVNVSIKRVAT